VAEIERHPAVLADDLPEIYGYIARDNPAAAERVLDAVEATFNLLAQEPEAGVAYPTRNPKLRGLRMLPVIGFRNYLVFHRFAGGSVRVLYVAHGARHLLRHFRRTPRE
jgi:toxin ParE1/3/4